MFVDCRYIGGKCSTAISQVYKPCSLKFKMSCAKIGFRNPINIYDHIGTTLYMCELNPSG